MNRSEDAKKVGPPQKNSLDPLLIICLFQNGFQCEDISYLNDHPEQV